MKHIAIFASGTGTNAKNIIQHFKGNRDIKVACIVCNNPSAKVSSVAAESQIPFYLVSRKDFYESDFVLELMRKYEIDLIVLAGFLWMIPENLLKSFPHKIINIHPALLPKYGGKGMYGEKVHEAVFQHKETESGITIHFVNEKYDDGEIILQKKISIEKNETPEMLGQKIHALEYEWYPKVIAKLLAE